MVVTSKGRVPKARILRIAYVVSFIAGAALMPRHASAVDRFWVGLDGFWEQTNPSPATSGGPSGASMPVNGDNAFIISTSTFQVTRDSLVPSYTPPGPALVRLAGTGGAVVTVAQIAGAGTMAASALDVGYDGTAQYLQHDANAIFGQLSIGAFGNGVGTYTIDGAAAALTVNGDLYLGKNNNNLGTFN